MTYRNEIRVDGPVLPRAGNVYVVVTRDRVVKDLTRTSNPATLAVCTELVRATNLAAKETLAHIRYVGNEK